MVVLRTAIWGHACRLTVLLEISQSGFADMVFDTGVQKKEAVGFDAVLEGALRDNGFPASLPTELILTWTEQEPLGEILRDLLKELS